MLIWYGKQVATGAGAVTRIDATPLQAIPAIESSAIPNFRTRCPLLVNQSDDCFFNDTDKDDIHVDLEGGGESDDPVVSPTHGVDDNGPSPTPQYPSDNHAVNHSESASDGAASAQGKRSRQETTPSTQRRRRFAGIDKGEILEDLRRHSNQRLEFSEEAIQLSRKMLAVTLEKAEKEASCGMDKCMPKLFSLNLVIDDFTVMSNILCQSFETRQLFMMLDTEQMESFVKFHLSKHRGI